MGIYTHLRRLTQSPYLNRWIVFIGDSFLSLAATLCTLFFLHFLRGNSFPLLTSVKYLSLSLVCSGISFLACGTYKGIIRHSTLSEAGRLGLASLMKALSIFVFASFVLKDISLHIRTIEAVMDGLFTFLILNSSRITIVMLYHVVKNSFANNYDRLLIFTGDDDRDTDTAPFFKNSKYQVEGYLRVGKRKRMRIGEYKVYFVKEFNQFKLLVTHMRIKNVLFINRRDVENEQERIIRFCERMKVGMLMLPSIDELKDGKIINRNLPQIHIEDLLGREEIDIDMDEIAPEFAGKTVLVTGAAGSIGSELCRQLALMDVKRLILFDSAETPLHNVRLEFRRKFPELDFEAVIGDVRVLERVHMLFEKYQPQIVFHAAAYKHVPLMEENPCEAVLVNVIGTRQVADMALKYKAEKMIMISTDKAVNPTNVMGASKRLAEIYVQSLGNAVKKGSIKGTTQFITTRFGNVLGSNGSVIPHFREQIANGGPVTVTHPDIIRFFMTIPEACRLVMIAASMGESNEIFVFKMGKPVKIVDLATRMIELGGLVPGKDIKITFTGLRPGEKLYEEMLSNKENTVPTRNEKILIAKVREYNYFDIQNSFKQFEQLSRNVEILPTVQLMKRIIPEFISQNSKFETLDNIPAPIPIPVPVPVENNNTH